MALDFRGFAAAYARGKEKMQPQETILNRLVGTPEHNFQKKLKNSINLSLDPFIQASGLDISDWGQANLNSDTGESSPVDFTKVKSAGTAYMDFKKDLERFGGRAAQYARKNNLDNFIAFKQFYDQQLGAYAPMVQARLQSYKDYNNFSDTDMRNFLGQYPGLQKTLAETPPPVQQGPDGTVMPGSHPSWLYPKITTRQQLRHLGQSIDPREWGLGGKAAAGALGLGAYAMRNKLPSMEGLKEKAKGLTKKGAGSAAYGYAGTKGLGQATKALASLTGAGETGKALTQETGELAGNAIMYAIRKHGLPKIMKTVTKKLGYKVAAKTLGKLALGGIGAAGTGGVGAGLAALWTAKDIKDIYDIVTKMK